MKLFIYSHTSTVLPLKFGNRYVISSHTLLGVWLPMYSNHVLYTWPPHPIHITFNSQGVASIWWLPLSCELSHQLLQYVQRLKSIYCVMWISLGLLHHCWLKPSQQNANEENPNNLIFYKHISNAFKKTLQNFVWLRRWFWGESKTYMMIT